MQSTSTQGFTLLELLVVIAIIGILASILLSNYREAQKKPYDVAALQCGKAIDTAETTYRITNAAYASNINQLGADWVQTSSTSAPSSTFRFTVTMLPMSPLE